MTQPVNESFYDDPIVQPDGSSLVIVRDADGNQIGYNVIGPAAQPDA